MTLLLLSLFFKVSILLFSDCLSFSFAIARMEWNGMAHVHRLVCLSKRGGWMIAWNRFSKAGLLGRVCGREGAHVVFVFVLRSYH
jgi:hypothetical protein